MNYWSQIKVLMDLPGSGPTGVRDATKLTPPKPETGIGFDFKPLARRIGLRLRLLEDLGEARLERFGDAVADRALGQAFDQGLEEAFNDQGLRVFVIEAA